MKIFVCIASLLTFSVSTAALASEAAQPEKTTSVVVSNRDINRISCPHPIQEVFWSQEKPVQVSTQGNNAFVKFLVRRVGSQEQHVSQSVELHLLCGGSVYTLIMHPQEAPAKTIRLTASVAEAVGKVAREWAALPLETRVKNLTLAIYKGEIPDSFQREPLNRRDPRAKMLLPSGAWAITEFQTTARGTGLVALEVSLKPAYQGHQIEERELLVPELGQHLVAITLLPDQAESSGRQRAIVILRNQAEQASSQMRIGRSTQQSMAAWRGQQHGH